MVAFNKNSGKVPFEFGQETLATRVVERTRDYFARHPDISREEFLLSAVRREVTFREQQEMRHRMRSRVPPSAELNRNSPIGSVRRWRISNNTPR